MTGHEVLNYLHGLLGEAVLLPIPLGEKGPQTPGWQKSTFTESKRSPALLEAALRGGNIGVLLGPASGRLLALDIDSDELVVEWLAKHPWLADTLRTKGRRGCQFWLRLENGCDYPNGKAVYKLPGGHGELRLGGGGGAQSVIWGVHPEKMRYRILVDRPPLVISLADLDELSPGLTFNEEPKSAPTQTNNNSEPPRPTDIWERVTRYLDKCDRAVEGEGGHDTTFRVLCMVINGFALSSEEAWSAALYYNCKCEPPWSEKDLKHKVDDALNAGHDRPRGHLLESDFGSNAKSPHLDEQRKQSRRTSTDQDNGAQFPILKLPSDDVPIEESGSDCFRVLAKTHRFFMRGRTVVELVRSGGQYILEEVEPAAFRSRLEKYFRLMRERKLSDGGVALKPSRCSTDNALALLKTEAASDYLPDISIVTNSPIFTEQGAELKVLAKGYHNVLGGIYILKNRDIRELPLEEATEALLELLSDFAFISESDQARALASLISPGLRLGGLLTVDFPLCISEACESQTGKTYLHKMVCALYGEKPFVINRQEHFGVGSLDETISEALISGRPFLMFENVRGSVISQLLESALRGAGPVSCRRAYSRGMQVDPHYVSWLLSSNRAETTPDLANRSIITRLRKQPASYEFKRYSEGDVLAHVQAQSDYYLSAIYTLLCEWHRRGKPRTDETRHDFREWAQTLDWFAQELFHLQPLIDGHREEQLRMSNPDRGWLRAVALAVEKDGRLDEGVKPAEIADICEAHGLDIPGCHLNTPADQRSMQAGKILKRLFTDQTLIEISGFRINRKMSKEYNQTRQEHILVAYHTFEQVF